MPNIDLAIFDLDGTLLDTIEDLGDSVNEVLRARDWPEHGYDEYCYHIGDGMELLVRRSMPEKAATDDALVAEVLAEYRAAYGRNWNNKSKPYAGIVELLATLSGQGIRLAVLSNKPHEFTEQCVTELLPGAPFEKVYGDREGIPRKPDPGAALSICADLGVDPARTMFVGDTDVDIRTGAGAGMVAVGVLWGFRGEDELRAAGAVHIVKEVGEIEGLV
jgi:phosphoglycolate phosphatase